MGLLKISLLLIVAVSHVHSSTVNKSQRSWQHKTRKVSTLSDDLENCFCYPNGHLPTVQQLLDSQNNGQERVVIYLYKNVGTNEIKMYTPSSAKQMLIPDIPYESGDGLITVTTEYVYTLLYNNPNKIKVYNDHFETLIPTVTDSLPIGLNVGAIEHIFPTGENYINPNKNYNGNDYSLAKGILIANGPNGGVNEPQIGTVNVVPVPYDNNNLKKLQQYDTANNYHYTQSAIPQAFPLNPQATSDNAQAFPDDHLAFPVNPNSSPYKAISVISQTLPVNPQAFSESPHDFPGNPQAVQGNPQAVPGNPQAILVKSQAVPANPQGVPGNALVFPSSYTGETDQYDVYTFQTGQGSNKSPSGSMDIKSTQYMTFDIWFNQQMKRFHKVHLPNDIKTIDSNILRILVQKTFFENNIYISSDGVITDAYGKVIDAANLELRPLLLGETINYKLLPNLRKVIQLPKHMPYLEGILVTFISPPQILGIIPLGKTYLHETSHMTQSLAALNTINGSEIYVNSYENGNTASYSASAKVPYSLTVKESYAGPTTYYAYSGANRVQTSENLYSETYSKALPVAYPYSTGTNIPQIGASEVSYWSSGPYSTLSQQPYPTTNWNRRKMSDAKIEHHYEPPIKTNKRRKGIKKGIKMEGGGVSEEFTIAEPSLSINATESGRRFPTPSFTGVMKTLLYLLDDLPSRRGLNSTGELDILNGSEIADGGAPDFRIIGGNAATGSGTPLSSKGRSGSTEDI